MSLWMENSISVKKLARAYLVTVTKRCMVTVIVGSMQASFLFT